MKSVLFTRTLLVISALFFSILTCYGQDDPSDSVVGKWTKTANERSISFTLTSDQPGVYEFKVGGVSLTFTAVDDPVYGRKTLVEGIWSKASTAGISATAPFYNSRP